MRLKKLELFGFKSFVEKAILNFDSDIIGLVGPNGCGKSNIVDAMLWVLGEQSAKSLRAEKMYDVLFAGAEGANPANFAEVSLTLTDVSHASLGNEVTISRKFYRDGQMHYLINKKEARLKDIQDFFLGTGAGKTAFFVCEQGKIDEIINMTPEKRKSIFAETAGISKFLQRKKETLIELTEVEKNYNRLQDIHNEIEKQLRTLQKQAVRAKNYKERKEQLYLLEKEILLFKIIAIFKEIESLNESLDKSGTLLSLSEEKVIVLEKTLIDFKQKEDLLEKEKQQSQNLLFHIESTLKLIDLEIKNHEEAQVLLEEREKKALASQEQLSALQEEQRLEKGELLVRLATIEEEKKVLENSRYVKEKEEETLNQEYSLLLSEEKKLQKALLDTIQKESSIKSKIQEKELKKEAISKTIDQIEHKIFDLKQLVDENTKKSLLRKKEVEKISAEIESLREEIDLYEKSEKKHHDDLVLKNIEKEKIEKEKSELSAHIKALIQLQKVKTGFSEGTKALLQEACDPSSEIFGKLDELYKYVEVSEGLEKKTFFALRHYEETLIVKEKKDLESILLFAKKKKIQNFSLICVKDLNNQFVNNEFIYPILSVKNISEAWALKEKNPEIEVLTAEGTFIDRNDILFCLGEDRQDKNLFIREAEIKKGQKNLKNLEKSHLLVLNEYQSLIIQKKQTEEKKSILLEKRNKKEILLVQENFYLQRIREDILLSEGNFLKLEEENKKHALSIKTFEEELRELSHLWEDADFQRKNKESQEKELEAQIKKKKVCLEEKTQQSLHIKKHFENVLSLYYEIKEKIKILDIKREEGKRENERLAAEISESLERKGTFLIKKEKLEKDKSLKKEEKEKSWHSSIQIEEALRENKVRKKECEQEMIQEKRKIREWEKERHHKDLLLAEKKAIFLAFETQLGDFFHLSFSEVKDLAVKLDSPLKEAEEKVVALRYELENQSSINLAAIDECEEQEKRFRELDVQLKDILTSKEDLEKIISKLDQESRKLFKATFEEVKKNFKKNFHILFQGGEADLTLTDEGDILERGVEIIAKPPGKKMRSLSLLSGGEKCLTTLALLFALFEVKPAPFCILDEVDAPLDEANVLRFAHLLKEYVSKTQFIVVTHNKKTMASCDILVGVSMEKRGISKLLNLTFIPKITKKPESSHVNWNTERIEKS